jgi:hypothetical protein
MSVPYSSRRMSGVTLTTAPSQLSNYRASCAPAPPRIDGESALTVNIMASKVKYTVLLVIAIGFVACGILVLAKGKLADAWIGWMSILLFGAGIPLFFQEILRSTPRLIIHEKGVLDTSLGVGFIPWSDIIDAYAMSIQHNAFICPVLHNPEEWVEKLSPIKRAAVAANRALGFTEINLNLCGLQGDPHDVLELILKMAAQANIKQPVNRLIES